MEDEVVQTESINESESVAEIVKNPDEKVEFSSKSLIVKEDGGVRDEGNGFQIKAEEADDCDAGENAEHSSQATDIENNQQDCKQIKIEDEENVKNFSQDNQNGNLTTENQNCDSKESSSATDMQKTNALPAEKERAVVLEQIIITPDNNVSSFEQIDEFINMVETGSYNSFLPTAKREDILEFKGNVKKSSFDTMDFIPLVSEDEEESIEKEVKDPEPTSSFLRVHDVTFKENNETETYKDKKDESPTESKTPSCADDEASNIKISNIEESSSEDTESIISVDDEDDIDDNVSNRGDTVQEMTSTYSEKPESVISLEDDEEAAPSLLPKQEGNEESQNQFNTALRFDTTESVISIGDDDEAASSLSVKEEINAESQNEPKADVDDRVLPFDVPQPGKPESVISLGDDDDDEAPSSLLPKEEPNADCDDTVLRFDVPHHDKPESVISLGDDDEAVPGAAPVLPEEKNIEETQTNLIKTESNTTMETDADDGK